MTWPGIHEAGSFCINVLAGNHEGLTRRFAAKEVDRFADVNYECLSTGPALSDALAWIECRLDEEHDAGDHTIAVALVLAVEATSRTVDPLVFFRSAYGTFRGLGSD